MINDDHPRDDWELHFFRELLVSCQISYMTTLTHTFLQIAGVNFRVCSHSFSVVWIGFQKQGAPTCFPLPERKRFSRVWLDDCSAPSICGCGRVLPDSSGTWSHSFTQKINPQCVLARIDRFQPEGRWKPTVDLLTGKNQCWCNITEN